MKKKKDNTWKRVLLIGIFIFTILSIKPIPAERMAGDEQATQVLDINAKAVYVLDEKSGDVLYLTEEEEVLEIASITKLMTALVALEEMEGQSVYIDRDSYVTVGDTGLLIDERWSVKNLVSFMLVNSSNDAAEAIAKSYSRGREKFIEKMNDRATELGLDSLEFKNPTGLNETDEFGGKGNAEDVSRLLSYVYAEHPNIFEGTQETYFSISSYDKDHTAENTNLSASAFFGLRAGKTGYTDKAGGSYVARVDVGLGNPVIITILGTETREQRFEDMEAIREYLSKIY